MLAFVSLSGFAPGRIHAAAGKPLPPVTISIIPDSAAHAAGPAGERMLTAVVSAHADVSELSAVVETSEGVELVAGVSAWKGGLKKNSQHTIHFTARQSQPGKGIVRVVVTIAGVNGPAYTALAEYSFAGKARQKKKAAAGQEVIRKDRRGKEVVEHPLP